MTHQPLGGQHTNKCALICPFSPLNRAALTSWASGQGHSYVSTAPLRSCSTCFHQPHCSPAAPGHLGLVLLCTTLTSYKRPHGARRSRQEGRGLKGENANSPLLEPNLAGCLCWPFWANSAAQWCLWRSFLHVFRPLQPPSAPDQHLDTSSGWVLTSHACVFSDELKCREILSPRGINTISKPI